MEPRTLQAWVVGRATEKAAWMRGWAELWGKPMLTRAAGLLEKGRHHGCFRQNDPWDAGASIRDRARAYDRLQVGVVHCPRTLGNRRICSPFPTTQRHHSRGAKPGEARLYTIDRESGKYGSGVWVVDDRGLTTVFLTAGSLCATRQVERFTRPEPDRQCESGCGVGRD